MPSKNLVSELKKIIIYTISIFVILSSIYLFISLIIINNSNEVHREELLNNEKRLADVEKTIIINKVNRLISDVYYISDTLKINGISDGDFTELEKQWLAFSDRKKIYDQIRFIDVDGNEVVRINYLEDGSYITKKEDLQNKKDRYYFTDTIDLKKNQIYFSKIDLNIENGEIEQPIKPMIRLSIPFYDKEGDLKGIVILNYYAKDILKDIDKIASTSRGHIFILNSNGYWVYNSENREKEWTFMYEDRQNESFKNKYAKEWGIIKNSEKNTLITNNGIFSYTSILTSKDFLDWYSKDDLILGDGDCAVVSHIDKDSEQGKLFYTDRLSNLRLLINKNIPILIMIFITALLFSILIILNNIKREKIRYYSEYDTMTGVYNRRAGLENLNKLYKNSLKEGGKISVCFIDINGLKDVNDLLGHEAGDELILSIVYGIKINIKKEDFVARLGGDEFIIVFKDIDGEASEKIWIRINEEYQKINDTQGRKYIISASHGIEEFKFDANEYVDAIINSADEKMYNEKKIIKKDLNVIRK